MPSESETLLYALMDQVAALSRAVATLSERVSALEEKVNEGGDDTAPDNLKSCACDTKWDELTAQTLPDIEKQISELQAQTNILSHNIDKLTAFVGYVQTYGIKCP